MEKDQTITTTKTTKQQTTSTSTSRYLLPFSRITVSVAWYIYLTVLKCICNVGLKKIISRSIKLLYHTLHLHVPSPTRSPHLTSPYIQFSPYPYLPQQHLPIPDHLFSLSLTISGLSPPTLPYPGILGIQYPAFPFPLPALLYIHTYIHTYFPFYQPSLPLGRYPPTLPIYFSCLPAQPSSVPTCLPVLSCMLCVGNDDDEKSTL